ncbi:hypothetical protein [Microvirga massiliensis]|uniref:hypothetical protein n=1 Tax=Microvirga massiliensis TaxID=1033741 RepID=UPI0011C971FA|nr:hypothetical protein [Microvirga massiliensis]
MNQIVCHRAHKISFDKQGCLRPYAQWLYETREPEESIAIFPTGVGGVLYPPGSLSTEVLDEISFRELCPKADDIWLYWMGRRAGSSFKKIGGHQVLVHWPGSQMVGLHRQNLGLGFNDQQIRNLAARFGYPEF